MYRAGALDRGDELRSGEAVPSREMLLEQLPDDILRYAAPGGRCDHGPGCFVPAALRRLGKHDACSMPPTAIPRGQHPQPLADGLRPDLAASTAVLGSQEPARHELEQLIGEAIQLRLRHRRNLSAIRV